MQAVYPTSVGRNFNLVVLHLSTIFIYLQITIINISDLLLISRQDAKFMFSVYLFIDILERIECVPFDTLIQIRIMEIYQILS